MILRTVGVLILFGAAIGIVVAVLGLRRSPEKIRDVSIASLLTGGGMLCIGFGLAFSFGISRAVLVFGGGVAYLYGLALGFRKWRRRSRA
jgi:hypothetical protein